MKFEERFSVSDFAKGISNPFDGLKISFEGRWSTFNKVMQYLSGPGSTGIKRDIAKGQRDYLERFRYVLVNALLTEGSYVNAPFEPHSYSYTSPTGMIGIRTANYLNALKSLQITSKGYVVSMRFAPGATSKKSTGKGGLTMARYAYIFELGGNFQPARPIWGPTFVKMGGANKAKQYMVSAIGSRLNALGI